MEFDMQHVPYWNIKAGMLIDAAALVAVAVMCIGFYRHWLAIRKGEVSLRFSLKAFRLFVQAADLKQFFMGGILGSRVYRDGATGLFHGLLFWGMLFLFIGTALVMLNVFFGLPVMSGLFYKWCMAFGLDVAGLAVIIGLAFLTIRRLVRYRRLVTPKPRAKFLRVELWLLAVIISGFILEGLRINAVSATEPAFMGNLFAAAFQAMDSVLTWHRWLWWVHGLAALALIAYIPFSPLMHLILVPVNAALSDPYKGVATSPLDMEAMDVESEEDLPRMGAAIVDDFDDKRRLDFSACLWCGRCQEVCPATQTEKALNPKGVVNTLTEWLETNKTQDEKLIDVIGLDVLFECRTCGACAEVCPAFVNPIESIWQMRRNLVMERGEMPDSVIQTCRNLEAMMHPFSTSASPSDWKKGLDVPAYQADKTEYLLWIGCAVSYEDRAQAVGRAMVNILNKTGVSYGIIEEARCTGDPAKQLGDDYLFSMMAGTNIDLFNSLGVKKIITMCPHCYNSFKHYYPPLGAEYQLIAHAELLSNLIKQGNIKLDTTRKNVTYHDPCYLGRHNGIFTPPRNILQSILKLQEMDQTREDSFCCGAGGGNYWNEEEGQRINNTRAKQAFDIGCDMLVSSCPFCLLMLTDGAKNYTSETFVYDIAELVEQQMV
jgi:Fe-S oxidoreductase/nitrate reductase gamma subunit